MRLEFERGSNDNPRGHALIYFRNGQSRDEVWATYVVILPITVDLSKYVPPFLMNQMGDMGPKDLSAFAFPPAPEKLENMTALERLADTRDDDILFGGTFNVNDVTGAMMQINDIVHQYADEYARGIALQGPMDSPGGSEDDRGLDVNDVLYDLMSDSERLGELSKLIGRLRFAVDGSDGALVRDTEHEIRVLAKHLPKNNNVPELVEAVKTNDARSARLAEWYLQRCYHLVHEDYAKLAQIEQQIRTLELGEG